MDMFQRMNYILDNGELPESDFAFLICWRRTCPVYPLSRVPGNHHHDWQRIPAHFQNIGIGVGATNCLKGGADQLIFLPPARLAQEEEVNPL